MGSSAAFGILEPDMQNDFKEMKLPSEKLKAFSSVDLKKFLKILTVP